jgi:hypothetical protein
MVRNLLRIFRKIAHRLKRPLDYLTSLKKARSFQKGINLRKQTDHIVALVMSNAGQQQFFEDVCALSIKKGENNFFFLVNDCHVEDGEKIDIFHSCTFITPDVYAYISGVDLALHAEIWCRSPNVKNVCYIGHGFPGKHTSWSKENLRSFNHYFLYGPRDREILAYVTGNDPSSIDHIKFWEVGYPKYDAQINNVQRDLMLEAKLGICPGTKTILLAPAWDPDGALRSYGVELFEKLVSMRDVNIIVKLHPASLASKLHKDYEFYTGGVDWLKVLDNFAKTHSNFIVYREQKINPLFKIADVLLTDFSGVAMGFFIEDKPVVCIDCPDYYEKTLPSWGQDGAISKSNDLFNNGRNASNVVHNLDALEGVLRHALANREEYSQARKKIASSLLYHPGEGTDFALDAINSIL